MLTMDLYGEILKSEKMSKTIQEFATELVEDSITRDNFLQEFVDEIIDSMDQKDIIRAYANSLLQDLYKKCDEDQEEYIIRDCVESFPYVLERFGVDVTEN